MYVHVYKYIYNIYMYIFTYVYINVPRYTYTYHIYTLIDVNVLNVNNNMLFFCVIRKITVLLSTATRDQTTVWPLKVLNWIFFRNMVAKQFNTSNSNEIYEVNLFSRQDMDNSMTNQQVNCRFLLNRFPVCFYFFVVLFLVFPCILVAVQP